VHSWAEDGDLEIHLMLLCGSPARKRFGSGAGRTLRDAGLQRAGYFKSGLAKIKAAHAISANMMPSRNRSRSFQVFQRGLFDIFNTMNLMYRAPEAFCTRTAQWARYMGKGYLPDLAFGNDGAVPDNLRRQKC
jgi:hypothetical protein